MLSIAEIIVLLMLMKLPTKN